MCAAHPWITLYFCWPHNSQLYMIYKWELLQNPLYRSAFIHRNQWEACHSFLWIKMDNIMGVSFQPCNVAVISTSLSPMYATPEKYPPDPMREISFSHGPKSSNILRIWNLPAGWMETKLPLGIIGSPIKNIVRSWEELVWLQGHSGDQPNLLWPVMLPRNDLEHLPCSSVRESFSSNALLS